MTIRPTVSDVRRALGSILRGELKGAAGADKVLTPAERDALEAFAKRSAEAAGASPTVNDVMDHAMSAATAAWASNNQTAGSGKTWLSKADFAAITAADPALGLVSSAAAQIAFRKKNPSPPMKITLDAPPGVAMGETVQTTGSRVSLSAGPSVPVGTVFGVVVDGHRLDVKRSPGGLDVHALRAPEGYGLAVLTRSLMDEPTQTAELKITRDKPSWLPHTLLVERARAGLTSFIKNDRLDDPDWAQYFPTTWDACVTAGVPQAIDRMLADPATEVIRKKDTVLFVGRGPFDLMTEIEVKKSTGAPVHLLVEVD